MNRNRNRKSRDTGQLLRPSREESDAPPPPLDYLFAFAAGFGLGLAFFFGLWSTVSRLSRGNCAAWLFPLSSFVRTALLLVGFWWVARGDLVRLALCLVSWLIARRFMIRRCGPRAGIAEKGGAACA